MTDELSENERDDDDADAGIVGGGGPAATIDGDDDAKLDEHGDNLREAEPGDR
ncbi:MAG TPA: hypothetical protein VKA45_15835 [Gaiellaceae bacterium]|nr:hypothetical protein [Gaiellaceae bacterium]